MEIKSTPVYYSIKMNDGLSEFKVCNDQNIVGSNLETFKEKVLMENPNGRYIVIYSSIEEFNNAQRNLV